MRYFVFILFLIFVFSSVKAQISDTQVVEVVKTAQAEGKSQEEIIRLLQSRGVTKEQVERIKQQYDNQSGDNGGLSEQNRERIETLTIGNKDVVVVTEGDENAVFGRNIFTNKNLTFEPNLNISTPENYRLGPGDEVIIDIWGNSEATFQQVISPEGGINIPNLGPIYLNGKLIKDAEYYIKGIFSRIYSDLGSSNPNTFLKLSLGQIRSIQINVLGEVTLPGTYTLPSLATIFHALHLAGGVSSVGTLRDIHLYRNGKLIQRIDVYKFIMEGDETGNISLQEGDIISIGTYEKIVKIIGHVKRPMHYEIKENEKLDAVIEFAGGFSSNAYKKNINVIRNGETEKKIFTIYVDEFSSFVLENGDQIKIDEILDKFENKVSISGAVYRSGEFALNENIKTIKNLIDIAEGIRGDAFLDRALLYREKEDLTTELIPIDLKKLLSSDIGNLELRKNDNLVIASKNSLRESYTYEIHGDVTEGGKFSFIDNMTLEDAVLRAGGLLESASEVRIDIARRIKDPLSLFEVEEEAQLFRFSLKDGLIIDGIPGFIIEPFDEIYVRRSPGYREQSNVYISGEILFPGVYAKESANERLSDLIKRAGGVTNKAYIQGARLTRQMNTEERMKVRSVVKLAQNTMDDTLALEKLDLASTYFVGIDLEKAIKDPGGDADIVLREGDRLHISNYNGTVKIDGAVMYPNVVAFDSKKNLKNYIENAGGFGFRAKKRKAFVVYMNGTIAMRKGGRNPKIEPGCEIIIPEKPERKERIGLAGIMAVASSTTAIAAMITSILNNTK